MRKSIARLAGLALALPLCLPLAAAHASAGDNNLCPVGAAGSFTHAGTTLTATLNCVPNPTTTPVNDDSGTWTTSATFTTIGGGGPGTPWCGAGPTSIAVGLSTTGTVTAAGGELGIPPGGATFVAGAAVENAAGVIIVTLVVKTPNHSIIGSVVTEYNLLFLTLHCVAGTATGGVSDLIPPSATFGLFPCNFLVAEDPTGVVLGQTTTHAGIVHSGPWIDIPAITTDTSCTFYKNLGPSGLPVAANKLTPTFSSGFIPGFIGFLAAEVPTLKYKATDTLYVCTQEQWKDPLSADTTLQTFSPLPCAKATSV